MSQSDTNALVDRRAIRFFLFDGNESELARIVEDFRRRLFPSLDESYVRDRMDFVAKPALFLAEAEGRMVGFKIGYWSSATVFFSWLGGVDEAFRRFGIASRLGEMQHAHIKARGARHIETRTRSDNRAMLIVNLRAGFEIVGVEADAYGRFVVIQRKALE